MESCGGIASSRVAAAEMAKPSLDLPAEIARLESFAIEGLRNEWRRLYQTSVTQTLEPRYPAAWDHLQAPGTKAWRVVETHAPQTAVLDFRRPLEQEASSVRLVQGGYAPDPGMARAYAYRHHPGRWRRMAGTALCIIVGRRPRDHGRPLVWTAVLRIEDWRKRCLVLRLGEASRMIKVCCATTPGSPRTRG